MSARAGGRHAICSVKHSQKGGLLADSARTALLADAPTITLSGTLCEQPPLCMKTLVLSLRRGFHHGLPH